MDAMLNMMPMWCLRLCLSYLDLNYVEFMFVEFMLILVLRLWSLNFIEQCLCSHVELYLCENCYLSIIMCIICKMQELRKKEKKVAIWSLCRV